MDVIQARYDVLEQLVRKLEDQADRMESLQQALAKMSADLEDEWEGQGATAFFSELGADVLPRVGRAGEALRLCAQSMTQAAEIMRDAEVRSANLFYTGTYDGSADTGITNCKPISPDNPIHPQNEAGPNPRALPKDWRIRLKRNGDEVEMTILDGSGREVVLPEGVSSRDFLAATRSAIPFGAGALDLTKEIAAGNWKRIVDNTRGITYLRSRHGWQKFANRLGPITLMVGALPMVFDGIQLLDGSTAHIETTSIATLPDGTEFVMDRRVDEDANFVQSAGGFAGSLGGAKLGAAGGAAAGALLGPMGAVVGGVVGTIAGGLLGGEVIGYVARNFYDRFLDKDRDNPEYPKTDYVIENGVMQPTGANSGRIDIGRLLRGNGEVTLRFDGGQYIVAK